MNVPSATRTYFHSISTFQYLIPEHSKYVGAEVAAGKAADYTAVRLSSCRLDFLFLFLAFLLGRAA